MQKVITIVPLHAHTVSALTGTNNLGCSAVDENGYLHFPDYPVDKHHLSGATLFTVGQELRIYSFTPNCNGRIIGAEYCFHNQHVGPIIYSKGVLIIYEFRRDGINFVPKNKVNSSRALRGIPIDRTQCTAAEPPLQGLLCCERMTFYENGPIPLTAGEELVFAILAINRKNSTSYPALKYSTARSEYQVRTFEVDLSRLSKGKTTVFDHKYGPNNTNEIFTTFPILRFVISKLYMQ